MSAVHGAIQERTASQAAHVQSLEIIQTDGSLSIQIPTPLDANCLLSFTAIPNYKTVVIGETVAPDSSLAGTCTLERKQAK